MPSLLHLAESKVHQIYSFNFEFLLWPDSIIISIILGLQGGTEYRIYI